MESGGSPLVETATLIIAGCDCVVVKAYSVALCSLTLVAAHLFVEGTFPVGFLRGVRGQGRRLRVHRRAAVAHRRARRPLVADRPHQNAALLHSRKGGPRFFFNGCFLFCFHYCPHSTLRTY